MIDISTATDYRLVPYDASYDQAWDELVNSSDMGTFLHTRKFLSYHGQRFQDVSLLVFQDQKLRAVFPAAVAADDETVAISHPGITYGGLVHDGSITGRRALEVLEKVQDYYRMEGFGQLHYKAVPWIYHQRPSQDDLYALFRLGAQRYHCDLAATIDLPSPGELSRGRRSNLATSQNSGISISTGPEHAASFWDVLCENLKSRHGKKPVHSLEEIQHLKSLFPEQIEFVVTLLGTQVLAGAVLFFTPTVCHTQYLASNALGRQVRALDAAIMKCLDIARDRGKRYFDFGISTDEQGVLLNEGLQRYKFNFGAGSTVYEFYVLRW